MTVTPSSAEGADLAFDLRSVPFSRRGAWWSVSRVLGPGRVSADPHVVSHRHGMRPLLALGVVDPTGARLTAEVRGTPAVLRLAAAPGTVEVVFDSPTTLRLRGTGVGLRLTPAAPDERVAHVFADPASGAFVVSDDAAGERARVTGLAGPAPRLADGAVVVEAAPRWEVAVERIGVAREPFRPGTGFDRAVERVEAEFRAYLDAIAPWRTGATPAVPLAGYVLWSATVAPAGFVGREALLMSKHWMDRVWSWDHCFNALALAPGLPERALDQLELPFDHQEPSGALPDLVGHSVTSYAFTKPPVHGWAVARLARLLPGLDAATRTRLLNRLDALTHFWLTDRRAEGHRLPYYQHGFDSGWDNATTFLRESVVEAPDLAAYLALQLDAMAALADGLGDARRDGWLAERDALVAALVDELWDGTRFVARGVADGLPDGQASLLGLVPVVAARLLPRAVVDRLVAAVADHVTEYGVATEPPGSPHYEPDGYWRGPVWGPSTLLVEDGLRQAGATALADRVSDGFRRACERSGFAENFDALTGAALRDTAYTWTAACYLVLAREHVARAAGATP